MTVQFCRWIVIGLFALLQSTSTSSCDRSSSAQRIATLELKRADDKLVPLALYATPKSDTFLGLLLDADRVYYIEYNGEKHQFAGGGFETTYACVVQSPDKNKAVVLYAFHGEASGAVELDLMKESVGNIERTGRWLKDYQKDGWSIHHWIKADSAK